jgi:hypothetical protein
VAAGGRGGSELRGCRTAQFPRALRALAARIADRGAPARVLTGGYLAQAAAMAATALALLAATPPGVVYALAGIAASAVTITRPAPAAPLPVTAGRVRSRS